MKKIALAFLLAGTMAAPAFAADPVAGTWKTQPDENGNFGYVQITSCGAKICGTLVKSFDNKGQPMESQNTGKKIVWDMVSDGGGYYGDGKIWSPARNKTYSSKMHLKNAGTLDVSGCLMGGMLCQSQRWTRVK